jgi:carbonic anhydrase
MQLNPVRAGEPLQVEAVVVVGKEACLAIVAALDDMHGNTRKEQTWASRHGDRRGE